MSAHMPWTPEPWKEEEGPITLGGKQYSLLAFPFDYGRARQCVNACAGMADPEAEVARLQAEDHPGPHDKSRILADLSAQRDELLAALQATLKALKLYTTGQCNFPTTVPEVEAQALAAIAKAGAA